MVRTQNRTRHLIRTSDKKSFARVFFCEAVNRASTKASNIYGVIYAGTNAKNGEILIARIEDALARGYEEARQKLSIDSSEDKFFENAITRVNYMLSRLLVEHGLPIDTEDVSSAIISQNGPKVMVATWGQPFIAIAKHKHNEAGLLKLEISSDKKSQAPTIKRGYNNLVNGSLLSSDVMLIATRDISKIIGKQTCAATLLSADLDEAIDDLDQTISTAGDNLPFALITTDNGPRLDIPTINETPEEIIKINMPTTTKLKKSPSPPQSNNDADFFANNETFEVPKIKISLLTKIKQLKPNGNAPEIFNRLSSIKKIGLYALGLMIIFGNAELYSLTQNREKTVLQGQQAQKITAITSLLDKAEASAIYKDRARALNMIEMARGEMKQLPTATPTQQSDIDNLENRIQTINGAIFQIISLNSPTSNLAIDPKYSPIKHLTGGNDNIYINGNTLLLADNGQIKTATIKKNPDALDVSGDNLFSLENSLINFTKLSTPNNQPILSDTKKISPVDSKIYQGKWYLLDPSSNQIVKAVVTDSKVVTSNYVKNSLDLSEAKSLAIDGSIYVLNKNGVVKMTGGIVDKFSLNEIQPALNNANKIFIPPTSKNLYILDSSNFRIIKFQKTGELVKQFQYPDIKQAIDLMIDESKGLAYILTPNSLLTFSIGK